MQCGKWVGAGRWGEGFGHNLPERMVGTWIGVVVASVERGQVSVAFGNWDGHKTLVSFFL